MSDITPPAAPNHLRSVPAGAVPEATAPAGAGLDDQAQRQAAMDIIEAQLKAHMDEQYANSLLREIHAGSVFSGTVSAAEIMSGYLKSEDFGKRSSDNAGLKTTLGSIYSNLSGGDEAVLKSDSSFDDRQNQVVDAGARKQAQEQTAAQLAQNESSPKEGPFSNLDKQAKPREITAAAVALSHLADGVSKVGGALKNAIMKKSQGPGSSFQSLQDGGDGLGMNSLNQDPSVLSTRALDRLDESVRTMKELPPGTSPEVVAKAKAGVLDAADTADRYIGNEHRSLISKMSEGKIDEFTASDILKGRGDRFEDAMKGAEEAAGEDKEFKNKVKETMEKTMQSIRDLMNSIKDIAKRMFNVNENSNGPSAPAPGR